MTSPLVLFAFLCGFVNSFTEGETGRVRFKNAYLSKTNDKLFKNRALACIAITELFTPCQRSLPLNELTSCITNQAKKLQSKFGDGLNFGGINLPPLDPLTLTEVTSKTGTFTIKSTNVIVKGLKKVEIKEVSYDINKSVGHTKIYGNLSILCDYETSGTFLLIPISGNGKMTVKLYNTEMLFQYKIRTIKDANGLEHIAVYDSKSSTNYGLVKMHLSNLFGGDVLGKTVNQVLNDNWKIVNAEVGPPFIEAVSEKVHGIINQFYFAIPNNELLAD